MDCLCSKRGQVPRHYPRQQPVQSDLSDTIYTSETEALSQRVVEYHMDVELLPDKETLVASETLTWTHPGAKPVQELYFHLYPNAFSSMAPPS